MMIAGRLASRVDARKMMGVGVLALCWSMWEMTRWTPDVSESRLIMTIMVQGFGLGFVFIPLQVVAFATLAPVLRTDGASLFSLLRNIGAAIGVSITSALLAHNSQALHEEIGAAVTPFNRALQSGAALQWLNPASAHGAAMLDQIVNQQALITAYLDDYKLMIFTTAPALLLLLIMRLPGGAPAGAGGGHAAME
jgi:MFS transporter, DHA2 family, multidrug resistance protein